MTTKRLVVITTALALLLSVVPVSLKTRAPFVSFMTGHVYAAGGPVILDGTDAGYHGGVSNGVVNGQWIYVKKAYENLVAGVSNSYATSSNGRIAVVGAPSAGSTSDNISNNCGGAAYWGARTMSPQKSVDFYDGAAAIETFFNNVQSGTTKPLLIHIVDGICNSNKMDGTEYTKVNAAANAIATHVNRGGALFSNTGAYISGATNYGWLSTLFPTLSPNSDSGSSLQLTAEGQTAFPGLTNANIAGAWHNGFVVSSGSFPLDVLATEGSGASLKRGIIGGAAVTLPSAVTITATPTGSTVGGSVCFTVNVKRGNPLANFQGANVTFAVTGANAGASLASSSTDASGNTTSRCYSASNAGTDTITATAVNPNDSSNLGEGVVNVTWSSPPSISPSTQTVNGTGGQAITATTGFTPANFSGSVTYSVTSGTLPAGLSLNSSTGVITGTPTNASSATITITGTAGAQTATATITFAIAAASTTTVATTTTVPASTTTVAGATTTTAVAASGTTAPAANPSVVTVPSSIDTTPSSLVIPPLTTTTVARKATKGSVVRSTTTTLPPVTTTTIPVPNAPSTELGQAAATVGGKKVSVVITRQNNSLILTMGNLMAVLTGYTADSQKAPLDEEGNLHMRRDGKLGMQVSGFHGLSEVETWIFSTPVKLGSERTTSAGIAENTYSIPSSVPDGRHRVVLSGLSPQNEKVEVAVGVIVGADNSSGPSVISILLLIVLSLALILGLALPATLRRLGAEVPRLRIGVRKAQTVTVIDVRGTSEYEFGHLDEALHIENDENFLSRVLELPHDGTYQVYGTGGNNAALAMRQAGFTDVRYLGEIAAAASATGRRIVS